MVPDWNTTEDMTIGIRRDASLCPPCVRGTCPVLHHKCVTAVHDGGSLALSVCVGALVPGHYREVWIVTRRRSVDTSIQNKQEEIMKMVMIIGARRALRKWLCFALWWDQRDYATTGM